MPPNDLTPAQREEVRREMTALARHLDAAVACALRIRRMDATPANVAMAVDIQSLQGRTRAHYANYTTAT